MDKKISIKKIKPEMTQCRLIQLKKEQEENVTKERAKISITSDTENGTGHEQT